MRSLNMFEFIYKLQDLSTKVIGMNARNIHLVNPNNPRKYFQLANNKFLTKNWLQVNGFPCAKTIATIQSKFQISECFEKIKNIQSMVIKPSQSFGGKGILLLQEKTPEGNWLTPSKKIIKEENFKSHCTDILSGIFSNEGREETVLIEEKLMPNDEFMPELKCLSDLRVICLKDKIVLAMVRIPTQKSGGKANLHAGGIGLGVDLKTGKITQAIQSGQKITHHPDNQFPLIGHQIPSWSQIVEKSNRLVQKFPLKYIGIDWALATPFPQILEINSRPGLEIQNANGIGLRELCNDL